MYYFTHNWRGDIVGIYDTAGTLQATYEYDSWGNVTAIKDASGNAITDATHVANLNPFRYRGYYLDSETGLYYLMSRYYDPVTHRFVNSDGYFQSGGDLLDTNMNAYCRNNPINSSDPTGNAPCPKHGSHYIVPSCNFCNPSLALLRINKSKKKKDTEENYNDSTNNIVKSCGDNIISSGLDYYASNIGKNASFYSRQMVSTIKTTSLVLECHEFAFAIANDISSGIYNNYSIEKIGRDVLADVALSSGKYVAAGIAFSIGSMATPLVGAIAACATIIVYDVFIDTVEYNGKTARQNFKDMYPGT